MTKTVTKTNEEEKLLKLYSFYTTDEHGFKQTLYDYLRFFSSFILTLIGGTLFAFEKITDPIIPNFILMLGGIFVIGASYLGKNAAKSNYRRQLESIVKRFKIECLLDLDNSELYSDDKYMMGEPLVLKRYQEDFTAFKNLTSKEFVSEKVKMGFMKIIIFFYSLTAVIGLTLITLGLFKIITK